MAHQKTLLSNHPNPEFERSVMHSIAGDIQRNPDYICTTVGRIAHNLHRRVQEIFDLCSESHFIAMRINESEPLGNTEIWLKSLQELETEYPSESILKANLVRPVPRPRVDLANSGADFTVSAGYYAELVRTRLESS